MILFWGCWVFLLLNLLILVDRCNCPIDQWVGQLLLSLCIAWCHRHCISTILVTTSMWGKFCQTLGSFEGMALWTEDVGVWWVKFYSSPFAWLLATWYWVEYVQIMYEKQFQGCHGTIMRSQSIDAHLEDNSCISNFDTFFPWIEMAIVHVLGSVKDDCCFSSLAFLNSKLWATLDPHLPLVVGMYNQKFFTLENFPYTTTFDAWIGAAIHYGVIA